VRLWLPGVPFLALTATATASVRSDICKLLYLSEDAKRVTSSVDRSNIFLEVASSFVSDDDELEDMFEWCSDQSGSGLIYCSSRQGCERIAELLADAGLDTHAYHAGLAHERREKLQADMEFLVHLWRDVEKRAAVVAAPALVQPELDIVMRTARDLFTAEVDKLVIDDPRRKCHWSGPCESYPPRPSWNLMSASF